MPPVWNLLFVYTEECFPIRGPIRGALGLGMNKLATDFVDNMFNVVLHAHNRVSRWPRCNMEVCKGNLIERGLQNYNVIKKDVRQVTSYKSFKITSATLTSFQMLNLAQMLSGLVPY